VDSASQIFPNIGVIGVFGFLSIGAIGWAVTEIVRIIARNLRLTRQAEQLAVLKKSMIDRGMSAEEIERVIRSGMPDEGSSGKAPSPGKPLAAMVEQGMSASDIEKVIESGLHTTEDASKLVNLLAENGYSGDDIARILAALDRKRAAPVT
jgi:hypothetical protein